MKKRVAILMCCKNSKKFIKEQLISIKDQSYKNYKLFISIDRSVDGTTKLIEDITKELNINCKIFKGPNKGFSENYKFLTKKVNNFDYYAWCDHDDIWLKNKIKNGLNKINKDPITASMYVSNYKLINENGTIIGIPEYKNICSFQNSLLENISPGHTYLFNNCAKNLFNMCDGKLISHVLVVPGGYAPNYADALGPLGGNKQINKKLATISLTKKKSIKEKSNSFTFLPYDSFYPPTMAVFGNFCPKNICCSHQKP